MRKTVASLFLDWRAGLVALLAALIWMAHFDRWTIASWQIPTDYYSDAHESLARLKAASEGDVWPLQSQVITRLGAPFGAYWNAYPAPDKPLMLLLGGFVHLVGLHAAANLGLLLAQITAALAFYYTARWLRCRWEWAAAGALLFAYTYHTFHRGLAHFSLVFTWTVPLGLAAIWLVAGSHRIEWRRPGAWFCLVAAAALGAANPYNLFFWLQLMGWALLWQWLGTRRAANLQIGLAAVAIAVVTFAAMHAETWLHIENPEALPLLARNYGGTEVYALKPVEMFIPPPFHHWGWLAFFGNRYMRWSEWRGEVFLPYLGLAGIVGFVWLMLSAVRRILTRRTPSGQALSIAWILAYATVGGLTNVLALFAGFQVFRATNRAAIFVSAIVLFFLIRRISTLTAPWPTWARAAVAALLAAVGVFEQLPKPESRATQAALAAEVRGDAQFGRALEAALPPGAMVFQLPVLGFPEVKPPHQLGEYEHFRPYLATEHLRFSYGTPKTRARSRWQREMAELNTAALVRRLETYGFAALYLNRRGYADGGERILGELAALGYTDRLQGPVGNQIAIRLHPATRVAPPLAQSFTFGQGWHQQPQDGWMWAYDDATISYFNPYARPIVVDIALSAWGATPRDLTLERSGETVQQFQLPAEPTPVIFAGIELTPGVNRFKLCSAQDAVRQAGGQLRSFAVRDVTVQLGKVRLPENEPAAGIPAGASAPATSRVAGSVNSYRL